MYTGTGRGDSHPSVQLAALVRSQLYMHFTSRVRSETIKIHIYVVSEIHTQKLGKEMTNVMPAESPRTYIHFL